MTAEQINKYIKHFTQIWGDKTPRNAEENPMPEGVKLTVWCDNGGGENGFLENLTTDEMGLEQLIAQSWIRQSDLDQLVQADLDKMTQAENKRANGDSPVDLDGCVARLLPRFKGMETGNYFKRGEDAFAAFCQSQLSGGIGMKIRNELLLWEPESVLAKYFRSNHNVTESDSMSDIIIRAVYKKMVESLPQANG